MLPHSPERLELTVETHSAGETAALGEALGRLVQAGDFFALYGELGAGKTKLTQGILRGLGVPAGARSPTFTLINEYQGGRLPVYHMDAYRLRRAEELLDVGAEDYFYGEGLTVIEWADRVAEILPRERLDIHLSVAAVADDDPDSGAIDDSGHVVDPGTHRHLVFQAHGFRHVHLLFGADQEWPNP